MTLLEIFDATILNKYNTSAPRYTSYPTALSFEDNIAEQSYFSAIRINETKSKVQDLSLYIHIPFCHSLCYYCACNKIVTRHVHKANEYVEYLIKEISSRAVHFKQYRVSQIHFGGGTPSFLNAEQLHKIISTIRALFDHSTSIDMSIEIDPRRIHERYIEELKFIGFNRISLGVQDINQDVQEKINRVQDTAFIESLVDQARMHQFKSVNLDLIYGLPLQDIEGFERTLDKVIEINPDRISLFSYAHLPSQFAAQRKIKDEWLPKADEKLALFELAVRKLCDAGYVFIGMDHFAKPDDELCQSLNKGELHRNFQGYTNKQYPALLGLGVSSISSINNLYIQNPKELKEYYKRIDQARPLGVKGLVMSQDDTIRREVINRLMCNFQLEKSVIEAQFNIEFDKYFAWELKEMARFVGDDLLLLQDKRIQVKEKGRLVIRHICMTFDAHLSSNAHQNRYSKVI
ncbi:oxygen-independent coproporphyrinogen III oxidase [Glaciecola sp. KUL10]|uniref:oxygen-independent coproporphyrinogen III oxidase n=1 Tax=Glaciecola sp. (strain KUL10) TaxID=2161813 RepID=UPI000D782EFA|nr:oxygen-independent coproporphyrinogen III oxidase [Glaciecola sp. KUL10]